MRHLVLLGDSILDNGAYLNGGPAVIAHVQRRLPDGWRASLSAEDHAMTDDIPQQLETLPPEATHLLLRVGGNDALLHEDILETPVTSSREALLRLSEMAREFEATYRRAVHACLGCHRPLLVCTIYHGNFPDPQVQQCAAVALTVFNDVILRVAVETGLKVIDLRRVCDTPDDYANPLEPSVSGGAKIAQAIVRAVTEPAHCARGANVVAA